MTFDVADTFARLLESVMRAISDDERLHRDLVSDAECRAWIDGAAVSQELGQQRA